MAIFNFRKNDNQSEKVKNNKNADSEILFEESENDVNCEVANSPLDFEEDGSQGVAETYVAEDYVAESCDEIESKVDSCSQSKSEDIDLDTSEGSEEEIVVKSATEATCDLQSILHDEVMKEIVRLRNELENKDHIIQEQHNQLLRYQDDVVRKTQTGLIMELIGIADNVRTFIKSQEEHKDYDSLLDDMKSLETWVESSLSSCGVSRFCETFVDDTRLNPRRQNVVEVVETEDESRKGHYECDQPGYEWSVPYILVKSDINLQKIIDDNKVPGAFGFVLRKEEVIKLK